MVEKQPTLWRETWPMLAGIGAIFAVALAVMLITPGTPSDDAIVTLAVAAIGVIGTHVGHVSGRRSVARRASDGAES